MNFLSEIYTSLDSEAAAVAEKNSKISLAVGTEVKFSGNWSVLSGIVDETLFALIVKAKFDKILKKHVAAYVLWISKHRDTFEESISKAMETLTRVDKRASTELKSELEDVRKFLRFLYELPKISAAIVVFWLFTFVSEKEAIKIYRPWNENGEQGFRFAREDFTPFEWNGYAPQDLSLNAGGASAAAEMPNQGKLMISL
jgi:hypothetical protein